MQANAFKMRDLANRCLKRLFNKHIVGKRIRHGAAVALSSAVITRGKPNRENPSFSIQRLVLKG
jgi:hypothetical protein